MALAPRCKCHGDPAGDAGVWFDASDDVVVPRSAELEELWMRADDGDEGELERLAQVEGEHGLEERAAMPRHRLAALRAMAYTPGFSALPMLGVAVQQGSNSEARAAVESADAIASRKRAQTDLDDAEELHTGCDALLAAAKDVARPRPVRTGAVRALRMLADGYGARCVKLVDIPTDVDAR